MYARKKQPVAGLTFEAVLENDKLKRAQKQREQDAKDAKQQAAALGALVQEHLQQVDLPDLTPIPMPSLPVTGTKGNSGNLGNMLSSTLVNITPTYGPLTVGNPLISPNTWANITSSSGSGGYASTVKDMRKEMEDLCINIEKYDQLEGSLKKMADEFFAAVEKSTSLTGRSLLYFNTLRTYEVLISKDAFERIRKLKALTAKDE